MVFASLVFLYLFLPLNLALYYASKNEAWRNLVLVVFSLAFYAWGEPIWISLLLASTTMDYAVARVIAATRGTRWPKVALVASLCLNLGLLGTFKYAGLIVDTVNALAGTHLTAPGFGLPIGISFYTFQTISYVVDVYRGEVVAQRSYLKFLMFVSLFHQLVAGPIVRYSHIAQEIDSRRETVADFSDGLTRLCIGLMKKVLIANIAGEVVKQYLDGDVSKLSAPEAWLGLAAYTLHIYFDFSGYSDMAIGLGWMFGFHYYENFDRPYQARSVTDFWRRWHISLSTFFRDYVYIPLGGKERWPYRNLFIVWGLTGLWHGASWNFVLWGLYYGVFIALERLFLGKLLQKLPRVLQHGWLLLVVMLGWALFYFTDLHRLGDFLRALAGHQGWHAEAVLPVLRAQAFWWVGALLLCTPLAQWLRSRLQRGPALVATFANAGLLFLCTAMLVGKSYNPFIYYRF
jgi:alginate O-acetyltransferase complex protein AlgI